MYYGEDCGTTGVDVWLTIIHLTDLRICVCVCGRVHSMFCFLPLVLRVCAGVHATRQDGQVLQLRALRTGVCESANSLALVLRAEVFGWQLQCVWLV